MKSLNRVFVCLWLVPIFSCVSTSGVNMKPLPVVEQVDINRYLGTWHEIARYPTRFQKDCLRSQADYSLRDDGDIRVVNTCYQQGGKTSSIEGKAWVVDPTTNAKLKVRFFWPFSGDYWIVELGKDYNYVVVGTPNRNYLWILSRQQEIDPALFKDICSRLPLWGYDPAKLVLDEKVGA